LTKIIILEDNFKWHLEAFASELFIYIYRLEIKRFQKLPYESWRNKKKK